jgi:parvulin-like peptidyl-prolyl isomerase
MTHPSRFSTAALAVLILHSWAGPGMGETYGIAAKVNGKIITRSEVREAVQAQEQLIAMTVKDPGEQQRKLSSVRERALEALIERQLVLGEFEKMGGAIKPEYVDDEIKRIVLENFGGDRDKFVFELTRSGMTLKRFREMQEKMIIVQVMKQRQMAHLPPPTPADVNAFYNKNAEKFREKDFIKISTITLAKYPAGDANATPETQKKLAQELRQQITAGADFASKAKTYSQDSHADQGGEWDWIERAQMDQKVAAAAFALKAGAVSQVVDVGTSYMLILCNARRPGSSTPLEKVRPDIEKFIKAEKGREALNGWLAGLARKATIEPATVRSSFIKHISSED